MGIMCARESHLYCLYCIELKLFRMQLGRFVMEFDDSGDLGSQWEEEYIDYQVDTSRSRGHSIANTLSNKSFCCFPTKSSNTAYIESSRDLPSVHNPTIRSLQSHSIEMSKK